MARTPVGETIRASFGFISMGWRQAWAAMILVVIVTGLGQAMSLGRFGGAFVRIGVAPFLSLLIATMALGAFYRAGLRNRHFRDPDYHPGPAGLQWGGLEWRVLGASLIVGAFLVMVIVVFFVVWAFALGFMAAARLVDLSGFTQFHGDRSEALQLFGKLLLGPAGAVTIAIGSVALCLLVWLGARLSLLAVQVADTGSFSLTRAWATTRGAFWAVVVASGLRFGLALVVGGAAGFAGGAVGGLLHLAGAPGGGAFWGGVLGAVAAACFSLPMTAGIALHVYETQLGGGSAVADHFT